MMTRAGMLAAALLLLVTGQVAAQQAGVVLGRVLEAGTQRPLSAATVQVVGSTAVAMTDSAGRFRLSDIPAGEHALRIELVTHRPAVLTDVVVRSGRVTQVEALLQPAAVQLGALHARPVFFGGAGEAGELRTTLAAEEIRRAPGSAGDVSRILYGLPSVAKVNDQSNGLAVRGGTPSENLFLVDNIVVPNINHFPAQGSTSGPIGLLNVELIREVQFRAGGFGAEHGDRLSSVVEVTLRDGNPEKRAAQLGLDFTGVSAVVEGPAGGRAAYLLSVRRSYLDLLVAAVDVGASVAPRYGDYAVRLNAEPSARHRVSGLALWADDHFATDLEQALEHGMASFGRQNLLQGTTGLNWTALWSDGWLSQTSLAHTVARFDEDYTDTPSQQPLFSNRSSEHMLALRHRTRRQLTTTSSLSVGGDVVLQQGTFDNRYMSRVSPLGDTVPGTLLHTRPRGARVGVFAAAAHALGNDLEGTFGLRLDHGTLTGSTTAGPRVSLAWNVADRTTLSGSFGIYRQSLPLVVLATPAHRSLRDPQALHVVGALEHLLTDDTRITIELYHKAYDKMPMDPAEPVMMPLDEVVLGSPFFTPRALLVDSGRADAHGLELLLQKKRTGRVHALASVAWGRSRYRGLDGQWRPRAFDNGLLVSAEGGWRATERVELSARWIRAGGAPYTPLDTARSREQNRTVLDRDRVAAARYPAYHSLNLRVDGRVGIGRTTLVGYASVWNAYNRRNVAAYYWNSRTREPDVSRQWSLLPIIGIDWILR